MSVMKATMYEKMLLGSTLRGIAYMDKLPSFDWVNKRLEIIEKTYPNIKYNIVNDYVTKDSKPKITEVEADGSKIDEFITNCLSTFYAQSNFEIFLIKQKNKESGAILASLNHAFSDGKHMLNLISDLVSDETEFPTMERANIPELIKNVERKQYPVDLSNQISIPINPSPKDIPPRYIAKCSSFDIQKILQTCKSIGVKPQAFLSTADIYSISKTMNAKNPFDIGNQIAANVNNILGIPEKSPQILTSLVYTLTKIDKSTKAVDVMKGIQKQLSDGMEKKVLNNFACITDGTFNILRPVSMISNIGAHKTKHNIWVHGGMYSVPDAMKAFHSFTSHVVTTNNTGHLTSTYLIPGCEDEFINKHQHHLLEFINHPEQSIDKTIL